MVQLHIHKWLLEKPKLWLNRPLSAKWCLCFLIHCLGFITFCSYFGAQENEICYLFHSLPMYFPWSDWTRCHFLVFEHWVLSQLFHSPLSSLSKSSLVPFHFLPLRWYHLHIWGCWYFSQQFWFQPMSHSAQHFAWCIYRYTKQAGW